MALLPLPVVLIALAASTVACDCAVHVPGRRDEVARMATIHADR